MATHSSILAWKIPWTEEPGGLQSMGCQESDTSERLTLVHVSAFDYQVRKDKKKQIEFLFSLLLLEGLSTASVLNSEEEVDEKHLEEESSYKCPWLGSTPNLLNLEFHLF